MPRHDVVGLWLRGLRDHAPSPTQERSETAGLADRSRLPDGSEDRAHLLGRFAAKVDFKPTASGCLLWTGCLNSQGYGCFALVATRADQRIELAHRISWAFAQGEMPPAELLVRHSCDVRSCINPEHLSLGSVQDNSDDMVSRGRSLTGERSPRAKLTSAQVDEIRAAMPGGRRYGMGTRLALKFGVTPETIRAIAKGRYWKHIPLPATPAGGAA